MMTVRRLILVAVVPVVAAAALLVVAGQLQARGGEGFDLTGVWSIEITGETPHTCTATIDHLPGDTAMGATLECSGFDGAKSAIGIHGPRIDGVYLSAEFYEDSSVAWRLTLEGTIAPDGQSFSGEWYEWYEREPSGTFTATRTGQIVSPYPTLTTPVDMSGYWQLTLTGDLPDECDAILQQKGRLLVGNARCDLFGYASLSGRIDAATGEVSLGGGSAIGGFEFVGFASDSNTMNGTWRSSGFFTGTFVGSRLEEVDHIVLTGDWDVILDGVTRACAISFQQDLLTLEATVNCNELGAGDFTGSIDPFLGGTELEGSLGNTEMRLGGRVALDGSSFIGALREPNSESWRTVIAVPAGQLDRGILAIDCRPDRSGLQSECFARENDDLEVAVSIVVPPADLGQRLSFSLAWRDKWVDYHPTSNPNDEVVDGRCSDVQRTIESDRVTFSCLLRPDAPAGLVFNLTLTCIEDLSSFPHLPALDLTPKVASGPLLIDGLIAPCAGPGHGGYPLGDANCDHATSSLDAALALQFGARLAASLPCSRASDANRDDRVNSIDASIILQCSARLANVCH
jgi:hypothetical protein